LSSQRQVIINNLTFLATDFIEEELQRLGMDYTESIGWIWSSQNTEKAKELIDSIHFELASNDRKVMVNVEKSKDL